ncbi:esterase-like activity of phytase family protein [Rhodosalinus sp.]|uniref:esterase-like activity of phytase family protein n=1 Tax=Rhodosalinus sp. TaxID=2047741 RepID=UPI0039780288
MRHSSSVALSAAVLLLLAGCAAPERAIHLGSTAIGIDNPRSGGFSALEVTEGGARLIAVSDRAVLLRARIEREGARITGLSQVALTDLPGRDSTVPENSDAEGLATDGDRLWISYEQRHRVVVLPGGRELPRPPDTRVLPPNRGLEALAIDARKDLYALPEWPVDGGFPVYRFDGASWAVAGILPRRGRFVPAGADFGPDGALYVLERVFVGVGFRSRVRRVTFGDGTIAAEETLLSTPPGRHGNLEGIAVWTDAGGTLRMTMIADDNFMPFQRNEIVEYALP